MDSCLELFAVVAKKINKNENKKAKGNIVKIAKKWWIWRKLVAAFLVSLYVEQFTNKSKNGMQHSNDIFNNEQYKHYSVLYIYLKSVYNVCNISMLMPMKNMIN